jgi:hypothetical protein
MKIPFKNNTENTIQIYFKRYFSPALLLIISWASLLISINAEAMPSFTRQTSQV